MLKILDEIQKNLLNVLFPVFCNGCSKLLLKNENVICTKCLHNLPFTHHHTMTNTTFRSQTSISIMPPYPMFPIMIGTARKRAGHHIEAAESGVFMMATTKLSPIFT